MCFVRYNWLMGDDVQDALLPISLASRYPNTNPPPFTPSLSSPSLRPSPSSDPSSPLPPHPHLPSPKPTFPVAAVFSSLSNDVDPPPLPHPSLRFSVAHHHEKPRPRPRPRPRFCCAPGRAAGLERFPCACSCPRRGVWARIVRHLLHYRWLCFLWRGFVVRRCRRRRRRIG